MTDPGATSKTGCRWRAMSIVQGLGSLASGPENQSVVFEVPKSMPIVIARLPDRPSCRFGPPQGERCQHSCRRSSRSREPGVGVVAADLVDPTVGPAAIDSLDGGARHRKRLDLG